MKQIFFFLLLATTATLQSFASSDEPVAPAALESFNKTFSHAQEVSWTESNNLYKVNFQVNSQYVTGYYAEDGGLVALTKNILSTQLPIILETSLKDNYFDYWITELFEISNEYEVSYYVTLENAQTKLVLKSSSSNWHVQKKIKK